MNQMIMHTSQDKRAGQMRNVLGFVTTANSMQSQVSLDFSLFEKAELSFINKRYVAVEIPANFKFSTNCEKIIFRSS